MIERNAERKFNMNIKINFQGVGGHSSRPYEAKNPVVAGFDFIHALENNLWWGFSQFDNVLVEPVDFECGTQQNIIPDKGFIQLYAEYDDEKNLPKIKEIIDKSLKSVKEAYGVDSTVEY